MMFRHTLLIAGATLFASAATAAPVTFDIVFDELKPDTELTGSVTFEADALTGTRAVQALDWDVTETVVASGLKIGSWTAADPMFMLTRPSTTGDFTLYGLLVDFVDATQVGYWAGLWGGGFLTSMNLGRFHLELAAATPTDSTQPSIPEPSAALIFPLGISAVWFARRKVSRG